MIEPKKPRQDWLESYFCPTLREAKAYHIDTPEVRIKLDQNESPWDWPEQYKKQILDAVSQKSWNRYPEPYGDRLHELVGAYAGVPASCVLTGPGSNMLIALILDAMGRHLKGDCIVARPSFSLFEMHCRYAGISYKPWHLNENLDYDPQALADLPAGSLVVFASPNNPTGSVLAKTEFEALLKAHPESMFFADEAYFEFNYEPYVDLLRDFDNLLILRTFSKTMGAAGVRLGYAIGSESLITELRKLRLPYLLNHFAMQAAQVILTEAKMKDFVQQNIDNVCFERDAMAKSLEDMADEKGFWVKNSKANFILVRFGDQKRCQDFYQHLIKESILIRNISGGPGLAGCLRISIGKPEENKALVAAAGRF